MIMLDDLKPTLSQIQPVLGMCHVDGRSGSSHQSDPSLLDIYLLNMYVGRLLCPLSTVKSFDKYSMNNCFNVTCLGQLT